MTSHPIRFMFVPSLSTVMKDLLRPASRFATELAHTRPPLPPGVASLLGRNRRQANSLRSVVVYDQRAVVGDFQLCGWGQIAGGALAVASTSNVAMRTDSPLLVWPPADQRQDAGWVATPRSDHFATTRGVEAASKTYRRRAATELDRADSGMASIAVLRAASPCFNAAIAFSRSSSEVQRERTMVTGAVIEAPAAVLTLAVAIEGLRGRDPRIEMGCQEHRWQQGHRHHRSVGHRMLLEENIDRTETTMPFGP